MCHLLPISHSLFSSPTPGRAALGLHYPSPRVCTRGWAYADVITKISRIDRLPNFLTHGAPLARFARRSSAITERERIILKSRLKSRNVYLKRKTNNITFFYYLTPKINLSLEVLGSYILLRMSRYNITQLL